MIRNCQTAAEELSICRNECKENNAIIAQLEEEVTQAARLYNELEDLLDKKVSKKNEEIERLKIFLAERAAELAKVMDSRDEQMARATELSEQIKKLKQHKGTDEGCVVALCAT